MVDAQVHAVRHAAHLRRDPDRGGLGDPAGAGHEPGFVGGVSAWAEVMIDPYLCFCCVLCFVFLCFGPSRVKSVFCVLCFGLCSRNFT